MRLDRKVRSMVVYMARFRSQLDRVRVIMPFLAARRRPLLRAEAFWALGRLLSVARSL